MESIHSDPTRVFLVEDSAPIRDRLYELLDAIDGVRVVGAAETAGAAAAGILSTRPDAVVLDISLARGTGIDVLREVHPQAPEIVFIVLTNFANPQYERICLDAGASHFIDKSLQMGRVKSIVSDLAAVIH